LLSDGLPDLDYRHLLAASRKLSDASEKPALRLALLSDAATQQLVPVLRVVLDRSGYSAKIYEGPFDAIELEAYNPSSQLYSFNADSVLILRATQALHTSFAKRKSSAATFVDETLANITAIWSAIQSNSRATIIQNTFALPIERYFGNYDLKVSESFYALTLALNAGIAQAARQHGGVLLLDVDAVASMVGRKHFFDDRFWNLSKLFCSPEFLPHVAQGLADVLVATQGRGVKCIVVDLDDTLWGGAIGDDGLNGIVLNAHGEGEAFYRFQLFLRELQRRGILLAVCSKNEERNALLPFESHPEMVLRRKDITVFVANWNDKAENLRTIREILKIGYDSMVFLDDNPFERNLVRALLPDLIVPELPEDPSDYVRFLSELNLFETTTFSSEDLERPENYRLEAERNAAAGSYTTVAEFLQSLEMRIVVSRFDPFHLPRIAQLIQRSNQFNLTTRRHNEAECARMMSNPSIIPLYVKLSDRIGDHGLISVVILEVQDKDLHIEDWLMSCRVLSRGVEQYVMNTVFAYAASMGATRVLGRYIQTSKNDIVRDFYPQFGFTMTSEAESSTQWSLLVEEYQPARVYMSPLKPELTTTAVDLAQ
jgi:FkbH-like protein